MWSRGSAAIICNDNPDEPRVQLGLQLTGPAFTLSLETKVWALHLKMQWLRENGEADDSILICSDSRSALLALTRSGSKSPLSVLSMVELQWVPNHCGLLGNELAN